MSRVVWGACVLAVAAMALVALPGGETLPRLAAAERRGAGGGGVGGKDETQRATAGAVEAAAELPDDVDLVLVIDNASELRETPVGQSVRRFLAEAGGLDELTKAWTSLSQEIGWSEDVAFDRLFGRRVVLVSRTVGEGDAARVWAVLSDVSVETEQRLKEKLRAAPRSIDAGHQILSVENGQYELASHRRERGKAGGSRGPGAGVAKSEETVTLVLGPSGRGALFDQVVRVLAHGAERPLGKLDVVAKARAAGASEVLLLAQMRAGSSAADPDADAGRPAWRDFVVLSGRRAEIAPELRDPGEAPGVPGATWQTRVVVRDTARRVDMEQVPLTSDAAFRAMERGSLLAVMQSVPLDDVLGKNSPIASVLGGLPMPEAAKELVHGRQAIRLRAVPPRDRWVCTVAMETIDAPEMARTMDGAVARAIQTVEQRLGGMAPAPRDYQGVAPQAARVVGLTIPANGLVAPLFPEPVAVTWCYPQSGGKGGGAGGWWAMSVGQAREGDHPCPAASLKEDARALIGEGDRPGGEVGGEAGGAKGGREVGEGVMGRWVCLAAARPAKIEAMLPALLPDIRNVRSIMRRFDRLHVRLSVTETGDIQGDITATLAPSPK